VGKMSDEKKQNSTKTSDEAIKRAAELLLKGATMLNKVCPKCKTPLYKYKGRIICPTCEIEYVIVDNKGEIREKEKENVIKKEMARKRKTEEIRYNEVTETLEMKLQELTEKLEKSQEPKEIEEIARAIKSVGEAIKVLEQ